MKHVILQPKYEVNKQERENLLCLLYWKENEFQGLTNNLGHRTQGEPTYITLSTGQWVALMKTQNLSKTPNM